MTKYTKGLWVIAMVFAILGTIFIFSNRQTVGKSFLAFAFTIVGYCSTAAFLKRREDKKNHD